MSSGWGPARPAHRTPRWRRTPRRRLRRPWTRATRSCSRTSWRGSGAPRGSTSRGRSRWPSAAIPISPAPRRRPDVRIHADRSAQRLVPAPAEASPILQKAEERGKRGRRPVSVGAPGSSPGDAVGACAPTVRGIRKRSSVHRLQSFGACDLSARIGVGSLAEVARATCRARGRAIVSRRAVAPTCAIESGAPSVHVALGICFRTMTAGKRLSEAASAADVMGRFAGRGALDPREIAVRVSWRRRRDPPDGAREFTGPAVRCSGSGLRSALRARPRRGPAVPHHAHRAVHARSFPGSRGERRRMS